VRPLLSSKRTLIRAITRLAPLMSPDRSTVCQLYHEWSGLHEPRHSAACNAMIVPKIELGNVPVQVLLGAVLIDALHAAF
jgi:hypothetical protein